VARSAQAGADRRLAVEHALSYLFAYPVRSLETDQLLPVLFGVAADERDLVDLEALLRKHCQVLLERGRLPLAVQESGGQLWVTQFDNPRDRAAVPGKSCTLTAVNGSTVNSTEALAAMLAQHGAGDKVTLNLMAGDTPVTLDVQLVPAQPN
jgi:hypothetical protein